MHLTGRRSGRQPSWLLAGLFASVLLFGITSAAPVVGDEIEPASKNALAVGSRDHSASSSRPGDSAMHATVLDDTLLHAPLPTLHRRAGGYSSWDSQPQYSEHPSIHYPGEGWKVYRRPNSQTVKVTRYDPRVNIPVVESTYEELSAEDKKSVRNAFPGFKQLQANGWRVDGVNFRPDIGENIMDQRGIYYQRGRGPQTISVKSVNGKYSRYEFQYHTRDLLGRPTEKWATYEKLPEHLQRYLRWTAQYSETMPAWAAAIPHVRKRSSTPLQLEKRRESVGSNEVDTMSATDRLPVRTEDQESTHPLMHKRAWPYHQQLRTVLYPGKKIVLVRIRGKYRFQIVSEDGTQILQSMKWRQLPSEVRAGLRRMSPHIENVATHSVPEAEARNYGVLVGDHIYDLNNAYFHPSFPSATIHVVRSQHGQTLFQMGDHAEPVVFWGLPSHLRDYLEQHQSVRDFVVQAQRETPRPSWFRG